jgi:transposase
VRYWLEEAYPDIVRRAKAEHGVIYWEDETAVRQDTAWIRGYAPAGHTPTHDHVTKRPTPGITMISALTNQGLLRFEFHDGSINSERFIEFMCDLIRDAQSKVFLIVGSLKAHKAMNVQEWLCAHNNEIELFYLPPYSPELNPDELVNRGLKSELRTRSASSNRGTLRSLAYDFMKALQGMPQRIMN